VRGADGREYRNNHEPQAQSVRTPNDSCLRLVCFGMIKNSQRQKQKRQEEHEQKRKAARWLAGLVQTVVVDADGTHRFVDGDEAVETIVRYWDKEEAG